MITKSKFLKLSLVMTTACASLPILASNRSSGDQAGDPYAPIRYSKAFNQESAYKKHSKLLRKWGCQDNVFATNIDNITAQAQALADGQEMEMDPRVAIDVAEELLRPDSPVRKEEVANYTKDCLKPLNKARLQALIEPGIPAAMNVALSAGIVASTTLEVGNESMGGSFAVFSSFANAIYNLPALCNVAYKVASRPDNCLKDLEDYYATNKCFIPKVLWPKIDAAFVEARINTFAREKNVNFLNIALSLTVYKPKPAVRFKNNMTAHQVTDELEKRIDRFFKDYKQSDKGESLWSIKLNVAKFIDTLLDKKSTGPRYIYPHGLGGIGKTRFVQTLAQWIDELIPNSVNFEDLIIHSAQELEGTEDKPGAFLKALRKQLMQQKRGSLVMIDEATWLNDGGMIGSAKRTFNGDCSKLSTAYFGNDMFGKVITLETPPMLIFVASNDPINDDALASRFDIINYPLPNEEALASHAYKTASDSSYLKKKNCQPNKEFIRAWVQSLPEKNKNFRQVAGDVEAYILAHQEELVATREN